MKRYSTIKNEEILPFPTTQLDLEGTVLTDKSQSERNKHSMISLISGIQKKTRIKCWKRMRAKEEGGNRE